MVALWKTRLWRKIVIAFGVLIAVNLLITVGLHGKMFTGLEDLRDQLERAKTSSTRKSLSDSSGVSSAGGSEETGEQKGDGTTIQASNQQSPTNSTLSDALDSVDENIESPFGNSNALNNHAGWLQSLPLLPQINKNCTVMFQDPTLHLCYSSKQLLDQVALQVTLRLLMYHFGCLTDSLRIVDLDASNNTHQDDEHCFYLRPTSSNKPEWSHEQGIFLLPFLYPDYNNRPTASPNVQPTVCIMARKPRKPKRAMLVQMQNVPWRDAYEQLTYCDHIVTKVREALWIADSLSISAVSLEGNLSALHPSIGVRELFHYHLYPPKSKAFQSLQSKLDYGRAEPIAQSFPFHLFTTNSVDNYKPPPPSIGNRTLVIIIGSLRGGEGAWQSMYKHLLDVNMADLALMVGVQVASNNSTENNNTASSSPHRRAKYVWEFPEYAEWADAIDTIAGPGWRETFVWNRKTGLLGPVYGTRGSGAIIFMARYWVLQKINELKLRDHYDRFVVTRSDFYYKCSQDLSQYDERYVWVPSDEDWGGITDRQVIAPAGLIDKVLNVLPPMLQHPERYSRLRLQTTPEGQIWLQWTMEGIYPHHVRRFPMTMYTCAVDGDSSRWNFADVNHGLTEDGVYIKYEAEYTFSKCFCAGGTVTDQSKLANWSYTNAHQVLACR